MKISCTHLLGKKSVRNELANLNTKIYILSQDISSSIKGLDKLVSLPPLPYPTAIVAENATATPQLIELMSIILLAIT